MESELNNLHHIPLPPKQLPNPTRDDRPLLNSVSVSSTTASASTDELEKKFAAFVRRDAYGTMGCGELPTKEKVLLGLALVTLVPVRVVLAMTVLLFYYVICRVCTMLSVPNREEEMQEDYAHIVGWRRIVIVQCGRALARVMLFILGFYWISESYRIPNTNEKSTTQKEDKHEPEEMGRPGVIISNHVSYLDIFYHMSTSFPSFVAKKDYLESSAYIYGMFCDSKCLGCVYVQRESKSSDFKGVSAIVTERIREAHQNKSAPIMMLFPEGTTTNGEYILPFKTGGFLASAPVLPIILSFHYQRFSPAWDSISGARHAIFLLCQFVNYMEVTKLPAYYPSQQEKDDPKLYASNVRRLIASEGNLILSDVGLAEKRIYHSALNGLFSQC
ncbi:unnamed protein product [Lupinus luteus]|uniref:Phospholipid/glycerol acyltransferase domain-containing protein n=1 Tax=Lupinus luteus TaxID=3873 RepID=A0AAV1XRX7_LUPLU